MWMNCRPSTTKLTIFFHIQVVTTSKLTIFFHLRVVTTSKLTIFFQPRVVTTSKLTIFFHPQVVTTSKLTIFFHPLVVTTSGHHLVQLVAFQWVQIFSGRRSKTFLPSNHPTCCHNLLHYILLIKYFILNIIKT